MYNTYNPYFQPQRFDQPLQNRALLNGKSVDSIDVVKAIDIPLDGSVNYFPLIDGSAIVTKQLGLNGTTKITVYKPTETEEPKKIEYATVEDIDILKNEIKELKNKLNQEG